MRPVVLCPVAALLSSCPRSVEIPDSPENPPDDSGSPECTGDAGCEAWEICEGGACVDGDRNNDPEEAQPLAWDESVIGYLNPASDRDFYALTVEGGQFARIRTRPTGSESGEPVASEDMDTVVATYDATGHLLSWEDDYPTGTRVTGYDSVVYTYLASPGTYVVAVMDATTAFDEEEKRGGPDFSYVLTAEVYDAAPREADAYGSPGAEREVQEDYVYPVPVLLEEASDSDWIDLTLPYEDCPVVLRGSAHLDGTDATPHVRLWSSGRILLLDLDTLGTDGVALYPDVDGGRVVVEARDAGGEGGSNCWFFVFVSVYDEGYATTVNGQEIPYQVDAEPNDGLGQAQSLDLADLRTTSGDPYQAAFFWGTQDGPGDEDWYAVSAEAGWFLNVWGTADYNGSQMDPALEVYDPTGKRLGEDSDGSDRAPDLYDLLLASTGIHSVRVFDQSGVSEGGSASFYRFSLYLTDFEVQ
ncbi:MAG: hypothetical protein JXB39_14390 [Deltaproteobacteria bacterium]|nr:hypothetical protein [Deltaproteobacteria bacterium]